MDFVVCPRCHYSFREPASDKTFYKCRRSECGHEWTAHGETVQAVHGTERRLPIFEISVTGGASAGRMILREGRNQIGRDAENSIILDSLSVSRRHAVIRIERGSAWIEDSGSSCGTAVNEVFIQSPTRLFPRDRIMLGGATLQFDIRFEAADAPKPVADNSRLLMRGETCDVTYKGKRADEFPLGLPRLTFGRAEDRDVVLPSPLVSARHAILERISGEDYLSDVQSVYGTYVNGQPIIRTKLTVGDRIQIGPFLFRYESDRIIRSARSSAIRLSARSLSRLRSETTLLDDVSFTLQPGEFAGIVGPEDSGKSALLDALSGRCFATSGEVLLNGESLYDQFDSYRQHIGYVPADDAIYLQFTVRQVLTDAALFRLPDDTRDEERSRVIREILELLELNVLEDKKVGQLNSAERKRVSIGIELLSRPGILFLDAPTSGVDGGSGAKLMRLFRRIADQGSTVVSKTRTLEDADLFDRIIVLVPGGRLAFFGTPQQALIYFGIERYSDLFERLEAHRPETWQTLFRSSDFRQQPVLGDQPAAGVDRPGLKTEPSRPVSRGRRRSPFLPRRRSEGVRFAFRQFQTLLARQMRLQRADRSAFRMRLVFPLLLAMLICLVCKHVSLVDFLLIVSSAGLGCLTGASQIVEERAIYRRERLSHLRLDAYVISKILPMMLTTVLQVAIMLLVSWCCGRTSGSLLLRGAALTLTSWNGIAIGLFISSFMPTLRRTMSAIAVIVIFQFLFAGYLVAVPDMNVPTRLLSGAVTSRWAMQACEVAIVDGSEVDSQLMREPHLSALRNLYRSVPLETAEQRSQFLQDYNGQRVSQRAAGREAIAVLAWLVAVFSVGTITSLRIQDST